MTFGSMVGMANIYTNQWGARVVSCDSHSVDQLRHVYGDVRQAGVTDEECPACRTERARAELPGQVRAALLSPKLSHTRMRSWCGVNVVHIYHRDTSSPSGVMLAAGIDEDQYNQIATELRGQVFTGALAPLSPTEGLCAPSRGR